MRCRSALQFTTATAHLLDPRRTLLFALRRIGLDSLQPATARREHCSRPEGAVAASPFGRAPACLPAASPRSPCHVLRLPTWGHSGRLKPPSCAGACSRLQDIGSGLAAEASDHLERHRDCVEVGQLGAAHGQFGARGSRWVEVRLDGSQRRTARSSGGCGPKSVSAIATSIHPMRSSHQDVGHVKPSARRIERADGT